MGKKLEIEVVDIWSTLYITCLKGYLDKVGTLDGKTVYKSLFRGHYYMLTDSRYGEDYYI